MTLFEIVALYAALNLLILCVLLLRVGTQRTSKKISLGDGGDATLLGRVRAHGNFIESTPLALIGLIMLASLSALPIVLHIFGAAFTFGRIAHAHGMAQPKSGGMGRVIGAVLTLLTFIGMAVSLIYIIIS